MPLDTARLAQKQVIHSLVPLPQLLFTSTLSAGQRRNLVMGLTEPYVKAAHRLVTR